MFSADAKLDINVSAETTVRSRSAAMTAAIPPFPRQILLRLFALRCLWAWMLLSPTIVYVWAVSRRPKNPSTLRRPARP
jgi:hypothetical protein